MKLSVFSAVVGQEATGLKGIESPFYSSIKGKFFGLQTPKPVRVSLIRTLPTKYDMS